MTEFAACCCRDKDIDTLGSYYRCLRSPRASPQADQSTFQTIWRATRHDTTGKLIISTACSVCLGVTRNNHNSKGTTEQEHYTLMSLLLDTRHGKLLDKVYRCIGEHFQCSTILLETSGKLLNVLRGVLEKMMHLYA